MDFTTIVKAFFDGAGPWAGLCVILLYLQWDNARREETDLRRTLSSLVSAFEAFYKTFQAHDARSERMQEALLRMEARKGGG